MTGAGGEGADAPAGPDLAAGNEAGTEAAL
jgi:hypothetical protein